MPLDYGKCLWCLMKVWWFSVWIWSMYFQGYGLSWWLCFSYWLVVCCHLFLTLYLQLVMVTNLGFISLVCFRFTLIGGRLALEYGLLTSVSVCLISQSQHRLLPSTFPFYLFGEGFRLVLILQVFCFLHLVQLPTTRYLRFIEDKDYCSLSYLYIIISLVSALCLALSRYGSL